MTQKDSGTCGDECYAQDRRTFGALVLGATVAAALPSSAAVPVMEIDVTIPTPDGVCDGVLHAPTTGAHPGVLVWADAGGLRPVFRDMGRCLAAEGYTVLTPNPFYRVLKAPIPADFKQEDRAKLRAGLSTPEGAARDVTAYLQFLQAHPAKRKNAKIGTTGYCMGGPLTMRTAALFPDRIAAAGSFHGGGLVTDQPDSPHLLIPKMKARYLVAIADNDDKRQPDAKAKLKEAFDAVKNPADIEVFEGANHGWCVAGHQAYHEAQAERAWTKLLALFKSTLA